MVLVIAAVKSVKIKMQLSKSASTGYMRHKYRYRELQPLVLARAGFT